MFDELLDICVERWPFWKFIYTRSANEMSGIEKLQGLRQKFEAKNKERPLYLQAMACSAGQLFF